MLVPPTDPQSPCLNYNYVILTTSLFFLKVPITSLPHNLEFPTAQFPRRIRIFIFVNCHHNSLDYLLKIFPGAGKNDGHSISEERGRRGLDTLRFAFEPLPDQPTDTSQTVLPKLSSFVGPDTPRFAFEPPPDQPTDTSQNVLPDPISDFWIPPNVECVRATNLALVRRRILKIQKAVEQNPRLSTQYLLILDADNAQREKLFAKRMSGVRATFDDSKILLRIMPGVSHDSLIGLFSVHLVTAMAMVGIPSGSDSWIPTGTTRRRGHYCGKEPDYSMVPIANTPLALQTTPLKNNVWPSFVVEAGYSESLSQLRKDARWWWRNSDRETKVILLFDIRRSPSYSVHVEVWEEVFRQPTGVITQSVAAYQIQFQDTAPYLECTYSADVNTSASHTPIHLNSSYLMRQGSAASIQPPITLSPAMLTDICKQLA